MKNVFLLLATGLFSINTFASTVQTPVQTPISGDGQQVIYFLSKYCADALSDAAKTGAWIGNTSYSGNWDSGAEPFTVSYAMFRQVGFTVSQSAGTIELKATPIENPPLDGSSLDISCTYQ